MNPGRRVVAAVVVATALGFVAGLVIRAVLLRDPQVRVIHAWRQETEGRFRGDPWGRGWRAIDPASGRWVYSMGPDGVDDRGWEDDVFVALGRASRGIHPWVALVESAPWLLPFTVALAWVGLLILRSIRPGPVLLEPVLIAALGGPACLPLHRLTALVLDASSRGRASCGWSCTPRRTPRASSMCSDIRALVTQGE